MKENEILIDEYRGEKEELLSLIKRFWLVHNDYVEPDEEAMEDLSSWTDEGHKVYIISKEDSAIGFIHIGSRGVEMDWIEDLFIIPEESGKGYGSIALEMIEQKIREYSTSAYIEVAARNTRALKLYYKHGYDCLNTITIRKDFKPDEYKIMQKENLFGYEFEVKEYNEPD